MTEPTRCPDCGESNPADADSCARCNYPLARSEATAAATPAPEAAAEPATSAGEAPGAPDSAADAPREPVIYLRPPRRRQRGESQQALSLWLLFGFIMAATVVYIAVKANVDRAHEPVEGAGAQQQQRADQLLEALAQDSTNVEAHVGLGNVLYDTGNWADAIVHYKAALRRDSTRTAVLVDLGVSYYNLSRPDEAEGYFRRALQQDPHQAVALFNLGIVNERRKNFDEAFQFFHRALQSSPPEEMKQAVIDALQRIQTEQGKKAPPLPDGR